MASAWRPTAIAAGLAAVAGAAAFALWRVRGRDFRLQRWRENLATHHVSAGLFAAGVGYSSLLWLQDVLRLICVTLAFGVVLAPSQIATLSMLAMIGGAVPAIAGLGPVEGGLVAGLVAFGVDLPTAAAVTALERAISYGFSTSAGAVVIGVMGGRSMWDAARTPHAPEREADAARS